nr:hypothetical protein [Tanacetum cinerariifolium]
NYISFNVSPVMLMEDLELLENSVDEELPLAREESLIEAHRDVERDRTVDMVFHYIQKWTRLNMYLVGQQHRESKAPNDSDQDEMYENLIEIQLKDIKMKPRIEVVGFNEKVVHENRFQDGNGKKDDHVGLTSHDWEVSDVGLQAVDEDNDERLNSNKENESVTLENSVASDVVYQVNDNEISQVHRDVQYDIPIEKIKMTLETPHHVKSEKIIERLCNLKRIRLVVVQVLACIAALLDLGFILTGNNDLLLGRTLLAIHRINMRVDGRTMVHTSVGNSCTFNLTQGCHVDQEQEYFLGTRAANVIESQPMKLVNVNVEVKPCNILTAA